MVGLYKEDGTMIINELEYATNFFQQTIGLMFRKHLDGGMVFVLDHEEYEPVHMLFMRFPLDDIFLNANRRIIYKAENLRPWAGFCSPPIKWKYLIEMNAGKIREYDLHIGDKVKIE